MSFRQLVNELLEDEKAGLTYRNSKGQLWYKSFPDPDEPPRESLNDIVKSYWESQKRAMARLAGRRQDTSLQDMIKALKAEGETMSAQLSEMRKAQIADNFAAAVQRHAAFGQKLTAEVKARTLSAEQTAILESRWNANGSALEMVGKRLGLR